MKWHLQKKTKVGKLKPKFIWILISLQLLGQSFCGMLHIPLAMLHCLSQFLDPAWCQFWFMIGVPDADARFKVSVAEAQKTDVNVGKYPGLEGSGLVRH
jgi:hypothetical protein